MILLATEKPFAAVAVQGIEKIVTEAGYEIKKLEKYADKQQLLEAVTDAEAIIIRSDKIDREVLEAAPNLKIVVRAGAGYDNVDLEAAKERGVIVQNTPGQNANAVAELALGLLVYAVRNFYDGTSGSELQGKTLGIHAFGNVGRNVARLAQGFGMKVYAYDAYCPKEVIEQAGVTPVDSVEELYEKSQIVSLHIPATPETRKSINAALLSKMPKNAVLLNTARQEIIDEESLISFMQERTDFRYVTDIQPLANLQFTEHFPNRYFSTPKKMGAQTAEANINAGLAAARQIVAYLQTGENKYQVNK